MPPPPASLTIISCKYENRQRLQFTNEFAKTQQQQHEKISTVLFYQVVPTLSKQSKAQQIMGIGYAFFSIIPSDLKSVRVTCDVGYLYANFSLLRPLFST